MNKLAIFFILWNTVEYIYNSRNQANSLNSLYEDSSCISYSNMLQTFKLMWWFQNISIMTLSIENRVINKTILLMFLVCSTNEILKKKTINNFKDIRLEYTFYITRKRSVFYIALQSVKLNFHKKNNKSK